MIFSRGTSWIQNQISSSCNYFPRFCYIQDVVDYEKSVFILTDGFHFIHSIFENNSFLEMMKGFSHKRLQLKGGVVLLQEYSFTHVKCLAELKIEKCLYFGEGTLSFETKNINENTTNNSEIVKTGALHKSIVFNYLNQHITSTQDVIKTFKRGDNLYASTEQSLFDESDQSNYNNNVVESSINDMRKTITCKSGSIESNSSQESLDNVFSEENESIEILCENKKKDKIRKTSITESFILEIGRNNSLEPCSNTQKQEQASSLEFNSLDLLTMNNTSLSESLKIMCSVPSSLFDTELFTNSSPLFDFTKSQKDVSLPIHMADKVTINSKTYSNIAKIDSDVNKINDNIDKIDIEVNDKITKVNNETKKKMNINASKNIIIDDKIPKIKSNVSKIMNNNISKINKTKSNESKIVEKKDDKVMIKQVVSLRSNISKLVLSEKTNSQDSVRKLLISTQESSQSQHKKLMKNSANSLMAKPGKRTCLINAKNLIKNDIFKGSKPVIKIRTFFNSSDKNVKNFTKIPQFTKRNSLVISKASFIDDSPLIIRRAAKKVSIKARKRSPWKIEARGCSKKLTTLEKINGYAHLYSHKEDHVLFMNPNHGSRSQIYRNFLSLALKPDTKIKKDNISEICMLPVDTKFENPILKCTYKPVMLSEKHIGAAICSQSISNLKNIGKVVNLKKEELKHCTSHCENTKQTGIGRINLIEVEKESTDISKSIECVNIANISNGFDFLEFID